MDLVDTLRSTGAARSFTSDPVSDTTVADLLDAARFAPSGGNRQPWRVAVITDTTLRRTLADLMRPVWAEYCGAAQTGVTPFAFGRASEAAPTATPNNLIDNIEAVPGVLAVAADLNKIALMDGNLDRPAMTGGASIYPFCWSILLAARAYGLGGVLTTFLSRAEPAATEPLGLPDNHALVATIFLGVPTRQITTLRRAEVATFATVDRFDGGPFR
jgi:nitroreductase